MGIRPSNPACFVLYPPWLCSRPRAEWHARHNLSRSDLSKEVVELAAERAAMRSSAFARIPDMVRVYWWEDRDVEQLEHRRVKRKMKRKKKKIEEINKERRAGI